MPLLEKIEGTLGKNKYHENVVIDQLRAHNYDLDKTIISLLEEKSYSSSKTESKLINCNLFKLHVPTKYVAN